MKSPSTIRLSPEILARIAAIAERQSLGPLKVSESCVLHTAIEAGLLRLEQALAAVAASVPEVPAHE